MAMNREVLKTLANFNIDSGSLFQKASVAFSYTGQITPEYVALCEEVKSIFKDTEDSMKILKPFMDNLNVKELT